MDEPPAAHPRLATRNSTQAVFMLSTDGTTAAMNAQLKRHTPAVAGSTTLLGGSHEAL